MKHHQTESCNYSDKIIALGIDKEILKNSKIAEKHHQLLYYGLKSLNGSMEFKEARQLSYFYEVYTAKRSQFKTLLVSIEDRNNAHFVHYAALAGNLKALKWIEKHHPGAFIQRDHTLRNVVHYALRSNNRAVLDYLYRDHRPLFLETVQGYRFPYCIKDARVFKWLVDQINQADKDGDILKKNLKKKIFIVLKNAVSSSDVKLIHAIHCYNSKLLERTGKDYDTGKTIAHLAAATGKTRILDWILEYKPCLLKTNPINSSTIAHYAAQAGNVDTLNWIRKHCPNLLDVKIKLPFFPSFYQFSKDYIMFPSNGSTNGNSIAQFAVASGKLKAVKWVDKYRHKLMRTYNSEGYSLVDIAFNSSSFSSALINAIYSSTGEKNKRKLVLRYHRPLPIINNVIEFLKQNYFITSIENLPEADSFDIDEINSMLDRNSRLLEADLACIHYAKRRVNPDLELNKHQQSKLYQYFLNKVPKGIPDAVKETQFEAILLTLTPANRLINAKKIILHTVFEQEIDIIDSHWSLNCCETQTFPLDIYTPLTLKVTAASSMSEIRQTILDFYQTAPDEERYAFSDSGNILGFFQNAQPRALLFKSLHQELRIDGRDLEWIESRRFNPYETTQHKEEPLEDEHLLKRTPA